MCEPGAPKVGVAAKRGLQEGRLVLETAVREARFILENRSIERHRSKKASVEFRRSFKPDEVKLGRRPERDRLVEASVVDRRLGKSSVDSGDPVKDAAVDLHALELGPGVGAQALHGTEYVIDRGGATQAISQAAAAFGHDRQPLCFGQFSKRLHREVVDEKVLISDRDQFAGAPEFGVRSNVRTPGGNSPVLLNGGRPRWCVPREGR